MYLFISLYLKLIFNLKMMSVKILVAKMAKNMIDLLE